MRAKMAGIFALGFACGVLVLTMALLASGSLRISSVLAGGRTRAIQAPCSNNGKRSSAKRTTPIHIIWPVCLARFLR